MKKMFAFCEKYKKQLLLLGVLIALLFINGYIESHQFSNIPIYARGV